MHLPRHRGRKAHSRQDSPRKFAAPRGLTSSNCKHMTCFLRCINKAKTGNRFVAGADADDTLHTGSIRRSIIVGRHNPHRDRAAGVQTTVGVSNAKRKPLTATLVASRCSSRERRTHGARKRSRARQNSRVIVFHQSCMQLHVLQRDNALADCRRRPHRPRITTKQRRLQFHGYALDTLVHRSR